MKIKDVLFSAGRSAFFFDDQKAIKSGAVQDGFVYKAAPRTEGFKSIRQPGEAISVLLLLEDGQIACGDCAAVQYSGAGGRDGLFLAETYVPFLEKNARPLLQGKAVSGFRDMAAYIDTVTIEGRRLHTALRYGLSQALLDAAALAQKKLKTEVLCDEYNLPVIPERIPIFGQSGDDRYLCTDKMILKEVDVLPHALMNNIPTKIGERGEKLADYVEWLVNRIEQLRLNPDYRPELHIDVYGNIGPIFGHDVPKMAAYLGQLEKKARGYALWIEGPVDMGQKEGQMEMLAAIREQLRRQGCGVKIVADEWCNTYEDVKDFTGAQCCDMVQIKTPDLGSVHNIVESVLYCRANGMRAYQGGTCNETDISSRVCVHVALAARAERILAKPGMGFDEGYSIVNNEMERTLAVLRHRKTSGKQ
ncbi:MAG: methylaspartate ammonia-lyase [Planctomycetales bacterium]|nr:methylaspartate ammonia-lyase [Planctomycetales bacterium]